MPSEILDARGALLEVYFEYSKIINEIQNDKMKILKVGSELCKFVFGFFLSLVTNLKSKFQNSKSEVKIFEF